MVIGAYLMLNAPFPSALITPSFIIYLLITTLTPTVQSNDYTKSHNIQLDSFTTRTIEYYFYFPTTGNFKIYPANVARQGTVVAVAKPAEFAVLAEFTQSKLETMDEILSKGSKEDILNFVATKNILNPNIFRFGDIYYLLKDFDFYEKFL